MHISICIVWGGRVPSRWLPAAFRPPTSRSYPCRNTVTRIRHLGAQRNLLPSGDSWRKNRLCTIMLFPAALRQLATLAPPRGVRPFITISTLPKPPIQWVRAPAQGTLSQPASYPVLNCFWRPASFPQFATPPRSKAMHKLRTSTKPSDAFGLHRPVGHGW